MRVRVAVAGFHYLFHGMFVGRIDVPAGGEKLLMVMLMHKPVPAPIAWGALIHLSYRPPGCHPFLALSRAQTTTHTGRQCRKRCAGAYSMSFSIGKAQKAP